MTVAGVEFTSVSPVISVADLEGALTRYRLLGFETHAYPGADRYGYANRGSVSLHLAEWAELDPLRTDTQIYLYVSDADAVHAEWLAAGVEGRLTKPHDTPYGLREFAYVDPDGTAIRVGSPLTR